MTSAPAAPPRARVADEAAEPVLRVRAARAPGIGFFRPWPWFSSPCSCTAWCATRMGLAHIRALLHRQVGAGGALAHSAADLLRHGARLSPGVALAAARLSKNPVLQAISWTYVWIFRSIPLIVQLLFWFNIAYLYDTIGFGIPFGPALFTVDTNELLSGLTAAVIGLTLHQGAYFAEIIRGGILSVDEGQLEAAAALGIPRRRQFFGLCCPRPCGRSCPTRPTRSSAWSRARPSCPRWPSPISSIRCRSFSGATDEWYRCSWWPTWYIVITSVLTVVQYYIERHYARGAHR